MRIRDNNNSGPTVQTIHIDKEILIKQTSKVISQKQFYSAYRVGVSKCNHELTHSIAQRCVCTTVFTRHSVQLLP